MPTQGILQIGFPLDCYINRFQNFHLMINNDIINLDHWK